MKTRAQALVEEAAHHLEFAAIAMERAAAEDHYHWVAKVGIKAYAAESANAAKVCRAMAKE